jgi:hypothetical protein
VTAGTGVIATSGGVTATAGNIVASAGAVSANTTVTAGSTMTAGTGFTATTGNITASSGSIVASSGGLYASTAALATLSVSGASGLGSLDMSGVLTVMTDKLEVTSSSIKLGTNLVAGVQQASADGSTLVVSSGYTLYFISQGSATGDFTVTLPSSPSTGQLLFVRNDSDFTATCSGTSVLTKTGRLFAGLGGAWVPLL